MSEHNSLKSGNNNDGLVSGRRANYGK